MPRPLNLHPENDKVPFVGLHHLPKNWREKVKSNQLGNSVSHQLKYRLKWKVLPQDTQWVIQEDINKCVRLMPRNQFQKVEACPPGGLFGLLKTLVKPFTDSLEHILLLKHLYR